ncbi:hypothetical protein N9878_00535 [bacterium]|nr:hypothetical protein [bacterium]
MPKLNAFSSTSKSAGPVGGRAATAADFGGGGQALKQAGADLAQFGAQMEAKAERKASLFREETVANDRLKWAQRAQELQDELPHGGVGISEILKQEMDEAATASGDLMPTTRSKEDYKLQFTKMRASVLGASIGIEAKASAREQVESVKGVFEANKNTIRMNPDTAPDTIEQEARMIDGLNLRDDIKIKMKEEQAEAAWAASADGKIAQVRTAADAERVQKELQTDAWAKKLDPAAFKTMFNKTNKMVEIYRNKEENAAITAFNEKAGEVSDGKSGVVFDDADLAGIRDPQKLTEMKSKMRVLNKTGAFNRVIQDKSLADLRLIDIALKKDEAIKGDFKLEHIKRTILDPAITAAKGRATRGDNLKLKALQDSALGIVNGIEGSEISDEIVNSMETPEGRAAAIAIRERSVEIGALRKSLVGASDKKLSEIQRILKAEFDTPGDEKDDIENRKIFIEQVKLRDALIKKDRAAYAMSTNDTVQKAVEAYAQDQSPENLDELKDAQTAAQTALGKDKRDVYLLRAEDISSLKAAKQGLTTEDDVPGKTAEFISGLEQQYGKHWPLVSKQLKETGVFSGVELVAANMKEGSARQELLIAANIPKKDFDQLTTAENRSEIKQKTLEALAPLNTSLALGAGGKQAGADQLRAVEMLATSRVVAGASVSDAVTSAAEEIALNNYHFGSSYRVPRSVNMEPDQVDTVLKRVMPTLNFANIRIPKAAGVTYEDRKDSYRRSLARTGFWATNGDETGVVLMDEIGSPVQTHEREPIEVLWSEMKQSGASDLYGARGKFR